MLSFTVALKFPPFFVNSPAFVKFSNSPVKYTYKAMVHFYHPNFSSVDDRRVLV